MKKNKLQRQIETVLATRDKQLSRQLYSAYQQSLNEITVEVKDLMAANDELRYPEKLKLARMTSLKLQIENQMDFIKQTQQSHVYNFLKGVGHLSYNELFYEFEMTHNIPINFTMLSDKALLALINTPVANLKLSNRLDDGVVRKLRKNILSALRRGFTKGDSYEKIARDLANIGQASYKRTLNIARTEGGRISGLTHQMSQVDAKAAGARVKKTWDATLDSVTRDSHAQLDGKTIEIDEYFRVNGHQALQPHLFGVASEDCNCRCRSRSVIKGYEPELRRDNQTGEIIDYKSYGDWVKSRSEYQSEKRQSNYIDSKELKKVIKESGIIRPTDYKQIYGGASGYIATQNSWAINNALRSKNLNNLADESRKTIGVLDKVIEQNKIKRNVIADRWVDNKWLGDVISKNNISVTSESELLARLNSGDITFESLGYMSSSLVPDKNLFLKRPIKLEIHVPKSSKVYVTDNLLESEMILPRGAKYAIMEAIKEKNANGRIILRIVMKLLE